MLNASTPRRQLCLASQQSNMQKLGCFCCRHFCFPPAFWSFECVGSIQHKIGQWLDKNLCARVLRKQEPNRCLFRPCLQFPREFFLFSAKVPCAIIEKLEDFVSVDSLQLIWTVYVLEELLIASFEFRRARILFQCQHMGLHKPSFALADGSHRLIKHLQWTEIVSH